MVMSEILDDLITVFCFDDLMSDMGRMIACHVVRTIYIGLFPYKFVPEFPLKFLQYQEMYGIYTILGTLEKHAMEC